MTRLYEIHKNWRTIKFNERDCKESVKALESKGCFYDDADLNCLETETFEPVGIACPMGFYCFLWKGKKTGVLRVKTLGNHITRQACEKELADVKRS